MPKMIVSIDGVVIKEVQLTKDRTSLGRRPYNDIVIDNLAVSGEHAVLLLEGSQVYLEDLNSTNGTYVNGKAVKKQLLQNNDTIEIGKYKIRYQGDAVGGGFEKTMVFRPGGTAAAAAPQMAAPQAGTEHHAEAHAPGAPSFIRVLTGAAAGRDVPLVKVVTTIGKPGVAVAAITKRQQGYVVAHVSGVESTKLNGSPLGQDPVPLQNGDHLELAGIQLQFKHG
jgi:predicted component of type VI protein secretion system